jgi:hypothetical protein
MDAAHSQSGRDYTNLFGLELDFIAFTQYVERAEHAFTEEFAPVLGHDEHIARHLIHPLDRASHLHLLS